LIDCDLIAYVIVCQVSQITKIVWNCVSQITSRQA
jgi:hypothetical protein